MVARRPCREVEVRSGLADFGSVLSRFFPGQTAGEVNRGSCFNWALHAKQTDPRAKLCVNWHSDPLFEGTALAKTCDHAFVVVGERLFDAEHPTGVRSLRALGWPGVVKVLPERAFRLLWRSLSGGRRLAVARRRR